MVLNRLAVSALRNLAQGELALSPHLNVIFGHNGSGKTSLLEAIHILALGRSFRTNDIRNVIQDGAEELTVFGRVEDPGKTELPIGIRKNKAKTEIRIAGERVSQAATLAQYLPVTVITPTSHRLIESERQYRRAYLDWGVFHVEPTFYGAWKAYKVALKQRNAAMKTHLPHDVRFAWDVSLVRAGTEVDMLRRRYLEGLGPYVVEYVNALLNVKDVSIQYHGGWPGGVDYASALASARDNDIRYGRTSLGPHRADIRIKLNDADILNRVSRGQQKLLVYALKLAQIRHLRAQMAKRTVMLLDDLTAELDVEHRDKLLRLLAEEGAQVFITTTEPDQVDVTCWESVKLFHVEHGRVREVA